MKKQFFYSMLMASAVLAGCSSEKVAEEEVGGGNNSITGDGFIAVNLNLPTTPSSRANDVYDDGLPSEYAVKDAALVIFSSNDESTATVTEVIENVITTPWNTNADNNVTTSSKKIVIPVTGASVNSGVLAILNKNGETLSSLTGKTFAQVLALTKASPSWTGNGILMTNAPLADAVGGASYAGNVQTLATISHVYDTEAAAAAGTADEIYVERAVAKVTMQKELTTATLDVKDQASASISAEIVGWELDNTNTTSYLVRNTSNTDMNEWAKMTTLKGSGDEYRFIGTTAISSGNPTYKYRTYWAKDPNYDSEGSFTTSADPTYATTFGDANPKYCFENTFELARQVSNQTTRVVLKVQLNGGNDLFIMNNDRANVYQRAQIDQAVKTYIINTYKSTIEANLADAKTVTEADFNITYTDYSSDIIKNDGTVTVASWSIKSDSEDKFKNDDARTAVTNIVSTNATAINTALNIVGYNDGISYYEARIKHFGDDLAPWKDWENGDTGKEKPTAGAISDIYPGTNANAKYLGRYGVLRNNWYDIKVNQIHKLGAVSTVALKGNPDDEIEQYISVKINILSWAKRTQSWDL